MNLSFQPSQRDLYKCIEISQLRHDAVRVGKASMDAILCGFSDVLGAMAVSKIFGIRWSGAVKEGQADVGLFEVKTISYPKGCLLLTDTDKDFAIAILAWAPGAREAAIDLIRTKGTARRLGVRLVGYIDVKKGKQVAQKHGEKYVVSKSKLLKPSGLEKFVAHFNRIRMTTSTIKVDGVPSFDLMTHF